MGAIRRQRRASHRDEDLRGLRAAQGAPGEVRFPARADRRDGPGAGGPAVRPARFWFAALVSSCAFPARAQTPEDLQRQLQQLKDQYESTTQELQRQIAALEQQIQESKQAAEATAERIAKEAARKTL